MDLLKELFDIARVQELAVSKGKKKKQKDGGRAPTLGMVPVASFVAGNTVMSGNGETMSESKKNDMKIKVDVQKPRGKHVNDVLRSKRGGRMKSATDYDRRSMKRDTRAAMFEAEDDRWEQGRQEYEQLQTKIAGVLIKLYDRGDDRETIEGMRDRIAQHLGVDPNSSVYKQAWMAIFTDMSLDGDFDQPGEDYTDFTMRQGEMGRSGDVRARFAEDEEAGVKYWHYRATTEHKDRSGSGRDAYTSNDDGYIKAADLAAAKARAKQLCPKAYDIRVTSATKADYDAYYKD